MISITIPALSKFQKALKQSPELTVKEVDKAIKKSIFSIRDEAIPRTPIKTGFLRNSYTFAWHALSGTLANPLSYAWKQHEGDYNHPRGGEKRYLYNAVRAKKQKVQDYFKEAMETVMNTIAKKTNT